MEYNLHDVVLIKPLNRLAVIVHQLGEIETDTRKWYEVEFEGSTDHYPETDLEPI